MTIKEELLILFLISIPLAAYAAYIRTIDLIDRVESLELSKDHDIEKLLHALPDVTQENLS